MGNDPSEFEEKLMMQLRDKIYTLRTTNDQLEDTLDAREAEIQKLKMLLEEKEKLLEENELDVINKLKTLLKKEEVVETSLPKETTRPAGLKNKLLVILAVVLCFLALFFVAINPPEGSSGA